MPTEAATTNPICERAIELNAKSCFLLYEDSCAGRERISLYDENKQDLGRSSAISEVLAKLPD